MKFEGFVLNDKEPIYYQIVEFIKKQVIRGDIELGEKLPSIREISAILGINPNTLQRVYSELERKGIIVSRRGLGSFVVEDKERIQRLKDEVVIELIKSFINDVEEIGINPNEAIEMIIKLRN